MARARIFAEEGSLLLEPASCGQGVAVVSLRGNPEVGVTGRSAEVLEAAVPRASRDA